MGSDGGGAIQGIRGNVAEANESVLLSIQQPFANHVDICLGGACPIFLIDLGSRFDSSPYCMR